MSTQELKRIVICILICLAVGFTSSFMTMDSVTGWYRLIEKPSFTPPNWIFGPAWTILYILMGTAAGIVWSLRSSVQRNRALLLFWVQLLFNGSWSIAFFKLHSPLYGLYVILPLLALIVVNVVVFYQLSKKAGLLMLPYLLWVSYATILNLSIYQLN